MKRISWEKALLVSLAIVMGACSSSKTKSDAVSDEVPMADAGTDVAPLPVDVAPPAPPADTSKGSLSANDGSAGSYTVQAGDTLMKIAFETYGDVYKWKDIYDANKDKIKNPNSISTGIVLNFNKPSVPVTIERNGEKYLIKNGDTLGTISNTVYGTKTRWKELWENNKQLITDPNKIFAGFYLYYLNSGESAASVSAPAAGAVSVSAPVGDAATSVSAPAAAAGPAASEAPSAPNNLDSPPAALPSP